MKDALGNMFANMSKMFADMVSDDREVGHASTGQRTGQHVWRRWSSGVVDSANGNVLVVLHLLMAALSKAPRLVLFGEGRYNEAVVPLPDGRKIPVEMGKGMGGNVSSSVGVNISNDGGSGVLTLKAHKAINLRKRLKVLLRTLSCGDASRRHDRIEKVINGTYALYKSSI